MRILRIVLIPVVLGLAGFAYVWVVDGGGELFTCVPQFLGEWMAGPIGAHPAAVRRIAIPGYLLLFVAPAVAYSIRPSHCWLWTFAILCLVHFAAVGVIALQDD